MSTPVITYIDDDGRVIYDEREIEETIAQYRDKSGELMVLGVRSRGHFYILQKEDLTESNLKNLSDNRCLILMTDCGLTEVNFISMKVGATYALTEIEVSFGIGTTTVRPSKLLYQNPLVAAAIPLPPVTTTEETINDNHKNENPPDNVFPIRKRLNGR